MSDGGTMSDLDYNEPISVGSVKKEIRPVHEFEVTYAFSGTWSVSVDATTAEEASVLADDHFQAFGLDADFDVVNVRIKCLDEEQGELEFLEESDDEDEEDF
jgi:hypothetical protein